MIANQLIETNKEDSSSKGFRIWACVAGTTLHKKSKYEYRSQISQLCDFLGVKVGTEEAAHAITSVTSLIARAYREHLEHQQGRKCRDGDEARSAISAPATVRKKMSVLRSIYKDLQEEGLIAINPFMLRLMPKIEYQKRPTEMIPFEKVWELLNSPGSPKSVEKYKCSADSDRFLRDRAVLAMLFAGALRRDEVVKIRVGGVRITEEGTTYLMLRDTKRKGDVKQVIANWASEYVWAWHARRVSKGALDTDYLVCAVWRDDSHSKKRLNSNSIYAWTKIYFDIVGLNRENFSPHSARATAVTRLLDQGTAPRDVREFSRHSTVSLVERYDKRRTAIDRNVGKNLEFPRNIAS